MMALVGLRQEGAVGTITLDRPPVNALSSELVSDLADAIEDAADTSIRAVVVTGAPHFAAGADISGFKALIEAGGSGAELGQELGEVLSMLAALPKPVIAAIRGYALGGGLELALACDLRIAAEDASLGQPEIKLGLIPGAGGTQRLTRLIGVGRAKDLVMTGRMVDAVEAKAIGLVDRVVEADGLDEAAQSWAGELADGPTRALAIAKSVIDDGFSMALADALGLERGGFEEAFDTADASEGVEAFLEKRAPRFEGS
jgi:enoyl-CoA hydratase